MSPRSERSSALPPSNPPALISTPTSSPTPLTWTVTAPPATVPSTTVSASWACALASCSCICWACWSRAFMSKPPPPSASNGFWLMILASRRASSLVRDLLDHRRAELPLEQLRGADALVLGVEVVGAGVGVGRRPVGAGLRRALVSGPGLLDRLPGGGGRGRGLRGRRRVLGHRGRPLGLGARIDDRVDLPAGTDHVDRGLTEHG